MKDCYFLLQDKLSNCPSLPSRSCICSARQTGYKEALIWVQGDFSGAKVVPQRQSLEELQNELESLTKEWSGVFDKGMICSWMGI